MITRPYSSFTRPENLRAARFREAVVVEGRGVALSVYRRLKQQKEAFGGMSKLQKHELQTMWWCGSLFLTSKDLEGRFNFKKPFPTCTSCNNCGRAFLGELRVNSLPWWIPTLWLCLDSIVRPLWLCWVKDACEFCCNLSPALLTEWPIFSVITQGWNGYWIKSQQRKLYLERKILLLELTCYLPVISRALCHWAIFPGYK